jgi:type VI protein secretion system component VasK
MNVGMGQRFGTQAIPCVIFLILCSALIWVGVGFAGYALYLGLVTQMAAPWAAAIAAGILVIGPISWAFIIKWRILRVRPQLRTSDAQVAPAETQDAILGLLAKIAQDKPLLAIVFAGILGASEAILHRRN